MTLRSRFLLAAPTLLALAFAGSLAGCPGSLSDFTPFRDGGASMCGDVPSSILTPQCAKSGCHVGATVKSSGNLDLSGTNPGTSLLGKMSAACGGLYIDTTTPEKSVLYTKLGSAPSCGSPMPLGGNPLSSADKDCVLDWIKSFKSSSSSSTSSSSSSGMGGAGGAGGGSGAGGGDAGPG